MFVAVYGTLKQGHNNNRAHLSGKDPIHSGFVQIPFRMYAGDAYPMIIHSSDPNPIYVEVFDVDLPTLESLDQLEAPYNYLRETIFIPELDRKVEIYVFSEPEPPTDFKHVESGKW